MHDLIPTLEPKDPTARLDYVFDWAAAKNNSGLTNWLHPDETITLHTLTITPEDLVKENDSVVYNNTAVLVWLKDGTADITYLVQCSIETNQGRKDKRSFYLPIKPR